MLDDTTHTYTRAYKQLVKSRMGTFYITNEHISLVNQWAGKNGDVSGTIIEKKKRFKGYNTQMQWSTYRESRFNQTTVRDSLEIIKEFECDLVNK